MRGRLAALVVGATMLSGGCAVAAELVVFERVGCPFCARFEAEIGGIYAKTDEGARAPLRRVDIGAPRPADLEGVEVGAFTPTFVLMDEGREKGRIRGYPGDEFFWMQLDGLLRDANLVAVASRP